MKYFPYFSIAIFVSLIPAAIAATLLGVLTAMEALVVISHCAILAFAIWIDLLTSKLEKAGHRPV